MKHVNYNDFYNLNVDNYNRITELHSCQILQEELGKDKAVLSTIKQDRTMGVDIIVHENGKLYQYGCRYRAAKWYMHCDEFTIRMRNHGNRTEIDKLDNIDYSIYCVLPPIGEPPAWLIYDMAEVRQMLSSKELVLKEIRVTGGQIMGVGKVMDIIPAVRVWNTEHPILADLRIEPCTEQGRFMVHVPVCAYCGHDAVRDLQRGRKRWYCTDSVCYHKANLDGEWSWDNIEELF